MPNKKGQPVIAIDGTSASGKSTLSTELAREMNAVRLEYSLMFRAIALHMLERGFDPQTQDEPTEEQIEEAVSHAQYLSGLDWQQFNEQVREHPELRSVETSRAAPKFSGIESLLTHTDKAFKNLIDISPQPVIAEGRTIGRYVYPEADVKFFVDAALFERANRRHQNLKDAGKAQNETHKDVLYDLAYRDHQDQTRPYQPTGFDSYEQHYLDTTPHTIQHTLSEARRIIEASLPKSPFVSQGAAR